MTETAIASRDNPLFKRLKKLADSARARREARMSLLDGEHLITAYLDAGGTPHTLVRAASRAADALAPFAARGAGAKRVCLADALFAELSPVATPTGVLAEAAIPAPPTPAGTPLVVVLEDIQDPGNLGAMLRTAAAAGATRVVLTRACHDPWSPKALRGGQGAQFVLPIETVSDLPAWLAGFAGVTLGLALEGAESLYVRDLSGPLALVVGNEGAGLAPATLAVVHGRVFIPMAGRVESLNAAAALAVAAFEAMRQRAPRAPS